MRKLLAWGVVGICAGLTGCGNKPPNTPPPPEQVEQARVDFEDAEQRMARLDREGGWSDEACRQTAGAFAASGERLAQADPEASQAAHYNQGIALLRCKLHEQARVVFEELLSKQPSFHHARVQAALLRYAHEGAPYLDDAIAEVQRAVTDSRFKSAEALVHLAILQLQRQGSVSDDDGADDFERARKNLRRALAVDDGYMPAFNHLALFYLTRAKREAGRTGREHLLAAGTELARVDSAALELAALVCSQAIRKDPLYAPIHNTAGIISAELGQLSQAAKSFARARELAPRLLEAHMNYAAVNLQFRGFARAEQAYRQVLRLEPKSYDAHLGLALALRGQIGRSDRGMKLLAEAEKHLRAAKRLDPERPEAYFNQAILVQEFRARDGGPTAKVMLRGAKRLLATFVDKAKDRADLRDVVRRAGERMHDIDQMLTFLGPSPPQRKGP